MSALGVPLDIDTGSSRQKLVGGLVLLGLSAGLAWLARSHGFMAGLGAAVFGIAGLSLLAASRAFSGKGPCPLCRRELTGVPRDIDGLRCHHCQDYVHVKDGQMYATPSDFVATYAVYGLEVEVGAQPALGHRCLRCAEPATATTPKDMITSVRVPGVASRTTTWTIQLPVCSAHAGPAGVSALSMQKTLLMRSYAAWKGIKLAGASTRTS